MTSVTMSEPEARQTITRWAQQHFHDEDEDITPEVEIVSITYVQEDDEWEAELEVSTSADNPTVRFWKDDKHGLRVPNVEY